MPKVPTREIKSAIDRVHREVSRIPDVVVKKMRTGAGRGIGKLMTTAEKASDSILDGAEFATGTLRYLDGLRDSFDGASFRKEVGVFLRDLDRAVKEGQKLADHFLDGLTALPIPSPGDSRFIKRILAKAPDLLLLPIAKALESVPDWSDKPGEIAASLAELRRIDDVEVDRAIVIAKGSLQALGRVLDLIPLFLPRDLTINVSIVGEGGGTEVIGNPTPWGFHSAKLCTDMLVILLTTIQGWRAAA